MFRVATEKEFLDAFRPRDRKHVELPPDAKFPMIVLDYLAWSDPSGTRVFLFFMPPGEPPTGIAFRRDQSGGDHRGPRMCEWCHAHASMDQIGLLTTDVNSRKRVGVNLCLDLKCGERIEEAADRAGKSRRVEAKKLLERMAQFTREALGITAENRA